MDFAVHVGWTATFVVVGAVLGIAIIMIASMLIPKLVDRLTPNLDEEKEIARGNAAVADYFGRVVAACILGVSIVVAAAVLAGIIAMAMPSK